MTIRRVEMVAVLPSANAFPSEVLEIASVMHAGPVFIQLEDGRMFATLGGLGLNTTGCIVAARDEHFEALRMRRHLEKAVHG